MEAFVSETGRAVVIPNDNINTDIILPKQFLKNILKTGFGKDLFYDWRYNTDGSLNEAFELNKPEHKDASILITGNDFGSGSSREHAMPVFEHIGGALGTSIAAAMLIMLAIVNSFILRDIWVKFTAMHHHNGVDDEQEQVNTSKIYRLFLKLLGMIKHNWQVAIVGFLFGLGFDTATQIAVLATSATAANEGIPWYSTMAFPLLFTAGMCLMDTVDGFFMSTTYHWVFSSPYRKVYYNLTITGISILAAGFIGFVDFIQSFSVMFGWQNGLTKWANGLDFNQMGIILVCLFVVAWIVAITIWHVFHLAERDEEQVI
ncbi:HoxN/HupN/NixA family nickel/cobalt transporter [Leuconostoc falkenbergense]|uniref:HoxN/HupN/NixA family nickel/cobalt transporter n=1 Tax=Leuconostoc falkenbergense TaxID=2766470 RepID=UPI003F97A88C